MNNLKQINVVKAEQSRAKQMRVDHISDLEWRMDAGRGPGKSWPRACVERCAEVGGVARQGANEEEALELT